MIMTKQFCKLYQDISYDIVNCPAIYITLPSYHGESGFRHHPRFVIESDSAILVFHRPGTE